MDLFSFLAGVVVTKLFDGEETIYCEICDERKATKQMELTGTYICAQCYVRI